MTADHEASLQAQVTQACREGRALRIQGGGSKGFYGRVAREEGETLSTRDHRGILNYQPQELVLSARAGTPLSEINATLARQGQMLGCEPPSFSAAATFGGMIAAGLAGPRRPFAGGVADQLLGIRLLNGRGEILRFGGRVMKNVAGYDISRLVAGSLGCLGVILEATVRVLPAPAAERSFRFMIGRGKMTALINQLRAEGFPVSASCHDGQQLVLRFSAGEREITGLEAALRRRFGFLDFEEEPLANYWSELREQQHNFFTRRDGALWRLSLAPAAAPLNLPGETLVEWNGALRWLRGDLEPARVFDCLAATGGHASLFRTRRHWADDPRFQPLAPALLNWHTQLKQTFDPAGILNPGRMYREL